MKFLIDKNLPPELCGLFEAYGHSAKHVNDTTFSKDPHILRHAIREGYLIVTQDIGFQKIIDQSCDAQGLFIPPTKDGIEVAIIPTFRPENRARVMAEAAEIKARIRYSRKTHLDDGDAVPEWKHRYWELRGVPLRLGVSEESITANGAEIIRRGSVGDAGFGTLANRVESLVWNSREDFYRQSPGVKGLVMVRGFSKPKGQQESNDIKAELCRVIEGMLNSMVTLSFARAQLVDIRIDRDGICYRIHDRNGKTRIDLNEIREIHDFERKLDYLLTRTGLDHPKIIEDQVRIVNGKEVVSSHRNFLRGPLSYIQKRIDTAAAAGIDVTNEHNVTKAINKKDKQFNAWVRGAAPPARAAEVEKLLPQAAKPQQLVSNFRQHYIMSNTNKSNIKAKNR